MVEHIVTVLCIGICGGVGIWGYFYENGKPFHKKEKPNNCEKSSEKKEKEE